jgi:hypothetical protein
MAKIGDTVRFLNAVGGGAITRIEGRMAYVTDEDGFDTPVLLSECVVVPLAQPSAPAAKAEEPAPKAADPKVIQPAPKPVETKETPGGDTLNVALLFEPQDIKHLSATHFDPILVNDSNYTLLYTVAIASRDIDHWTLIDQGTIEPNVQILLPELLHDDINRWERVSVQLLPFKQGRGYELKAPVAVMQRLDLTKFAKLHSFTPTAYSNAPVMTVPIVTAGRPYRPLQLSEEMFADVTQPKAADRPKPKAAPAAKRRADEPLVVDLHIDQLLDSTSGMTSGEMLAYQIETFHAHMRKLQRNVGAKVIFIHGKGDGVLRAALLKELRRCYPKAEPQDASFLEYGFGATQITIH